MSQDPTPGTGDGLIVNNIMTSDQFVAIYDWRVGNGGKTIRIAADAGKILEEVLELCFKSGMTITEMDSIYYREHVKALDRGEAGGTYDRDGCVEEVADVATTLASYIQKSNIQSQVAITKCLEKINGRKWVPDQDGVLRRPERIGQ